METQHPQNPTTMKSGKWIIASLLAFIAFVAVIFIVHETRSDDENEMREYVDSLFRESRQSITFDSIRSAIERPLLDSLRSVRFELNTERATRKRETQRINRETQRIRHRLDSLGPIDRPDL